MNLTPEELAAVQAYAADTGPRWKIRLRNDWEAACVEPVLQHLRNTHGPSWLSTFRLPKTAA